MNPLPRPSVPELTAAHLREGLRMGRWTGTLPGVARLAKDLDVAPTTIRVALLQLEAEGLLIGRGLGRSRTITANVGDALRHPLRVAVFRYDASLNDNPQSSLILTEIMRSLDAAGHEGYFCTKSQTELRHDVPRMIRHLAETPADAWVVEAGSHPLLEWCITQPTPCLALYGHAANLPIACAGPDTAPAYRTATRQLLALGHRRIVFIVSETHRKPTLGISVRAFLEELSSHGIQASTFNLPDWEESPEGFAKLLKALFQHTPPTALIIDEIPRFIAAMEFLARHGLHVPDRVSLIFSAYDSTLDWCRPGIAHMRWDNALIVRRVVRWVDAVRKGKPDLKTIRFPAEFVPGGSIGPAWKG